jgi:preprotein translocase subunit SecE
MAKNREDSENPVTDEESDVKAPSQAEKPDDVRVYSRPASGNGLNLNVFRMFKPNQGKQIRLWSALGAGLLIVAGWVWMVPKFQTSFTGSREWMAPALALAISAVVAFAVWYFVGVSRKSVDFLIATESEMKKVTWSSRKEVWGATKVVIGMVVFMAVGLFVVDLAFTYFFSKIGVLKTPF